MKAAILLPGNDSPELLKVGVRGGFCEKPEVKLTT